MNAEDQEFPCIVFVSAVRIHDKEIQAGSREEGESIFKNDPRISLKAKRGSTGISEFCILAQKGSDGSADDTRRGVMHIEDVNGVGCAENVGVVEGGDDIRKPGGDG